LTDLFGYGMIELSIRIKEFEMAKSISNKTKLQAIRIRLINDKDTARNLMQKFTYERDKDKEQYWLGRFDALTFTLAYVENIIKFEKED
jgi:hypothetical protein